MEKLIVISTIVLVILAMTIVYLFLFIQRLKEKIYYKNYGNDIN